MKKHIPRLLVCKNSSAKENIQKLFDGDYSVLSQFYQFTDDGRQLIDGELIFKLIDSHGLPLDMIIDTCDDNNSSIKWVEFIQAAWEHGWLSYQVYEKIKHSLDESINFSHNEEVKNSILYSTMLFICQNDDFYKPYLIKTDKGNI